MPVCKPNDSAQGLRAALVMDAGSFKIFVRQLAEYAGELPAREEDEIEGVLGGLGFVMESLREGVFVPGEKSRLIHCDDASNAIGEGEFGIGEVNDELMHAPFSDFWAGVGGRRFSQVDFAPAAQGIGQALAAGGVLLDEIGGGFAH